MVPHGIAWDATGPVRRRCTAERAGQAPLDAAVVRRGDPFGRERRDWPSVEGSPGCLDGLNGGRREEHRLPAVGATVVSQDGKDRVREISLGID